MIHNITLLITICSLSLCIHILCVMVIFSLKNTGVTGPICRGKHIFTQSFVSRLHFEIFHYYYPPVFRNWWSDDWVTFVYKSYVTGYPSSSLVIRGNVIMCTYDILDASSQVVHVCISKCVYMREM